MPIENDQQLLEVTAAVNQQIQDIQNYLGDRNCQEGKVRFPTGYLRTCEEHRGNYTFLQCHDLRSNIAYALMATDVIRWMLNRTTLMGTAQTMLIKQAIAIVGGIIEAINKRYLHGYGARRGYRDRNQRLVSLGVIDQNLANELNWVWQRRQNIHLHLIGGRDYQDYTLAEYNRCVGALHSFRNSLDQHGPLPPRN